jgi:hypothetical protein
MQVTNLNQATDGARKAIALHGLFKILIGRKLDRLISQLPSDNTDISQVGDLHSKGQRSGMTCIWKLLCGGMTCVWKYIA